MKLPVSDWDRWTTKIGYQFGDERPYGFHPAIDLNLITGGDSDLGQPLHAISDGKVTSVHSHTSKPTFGKHVHIEHNGPWGKI